MLTDILSILPMNGVGKEVLTTKSKELALGCIADYAHSLTSSSTAEQPNVTNPTFIKPIQLTTTFLIQFYLGGHNM